MIKFVTPSGVVGVIAAETSDALLAACDASWSASCAEVRH